MKQLTQAVFDGQSSWMKSAAVDGFGDVYGYRCDSSDLMCDTINQIWDVTSFDDACLHLGEGYDTTNWKNSAIDREVSK